MSNTYYKTDKLSLTAFVGGNKTGKSAIQLTLNDNFVSLNESETQELIINLLLRLNGNVTATGCETGIGGEEQ